MGPSVRDGRCRTTLAAEQGRLPCSARRPARNWGISTDNVLRIPSLEPDGLEFEVASSHSSTTPARTESQRGPGLDAPDEDLRVLRLVGVLGVGRELLEQLLAGPHAGEPDLDVLVRLAGPDSAIRSRARSTILTGSPMSSTKISPPCPIAAGLKHELAGLGDGHEVARHLGVGDGHRPARARSAPGRSARRCRPSRARCRTGR